MWICQLLFDIVLIRVAPFFNLPINKIENTLAMEKAKNTETKEEDEKYFDFIRPLLRG